MIINFVEKGSEDTMYGLKLLGILIGTQLVAYILFEHLLYYQVMIGVRSTNCLVEMIF